MSKPKKTVASRETVTPGAIMGETLRARANKLTDAGRETLMADAMRLIYGAEGGAK